MVEVFGDVIDKETRCLHYHGSRDIIALKCADCLRYYPCFYCHNQYESHAFAPYSRQDSDHLVVLCGCCQRELTIAAYEAVSACPACQSPFNPGCKAHAAIYFKD